MMLMVYQPIKREMERKKIGDKQIHWSISEKLYISQRMVMSTLGGLRVHLE